MKTFNNISKAIKFVALALEGTFGEDSLTVNDFVKYDSKRVNEWLKGKYGIKNEAWIIVRKTGCEFGGYSEEAASRRASEWVSSVDGFIRFYRNEEGNVEITSYDII